MLLLFIKNKTKLHYSLMKLSMKLLHYSSQQLMKT
jgi:hypothetical protein